MLGFIPLLVIVLKNNALHFKLFQWKQKHFEARYLVMGFINRNRKILKHNVSFAMKIEIIPGSGVNNLHDKFGNNESHIYVQRHNHLIRVAVITI